MNKLSLLDKIFICFFSLILSGCASFKQPFNPQEAAWSSVKGDKNVLLRGYYTTPEDSNEHRCTGISGDAYLMPDTPYFRDWMRILSSRSPFKESPSAQAWNYIRVARWYPNCIYLFMHVPPGNWLFLMHMNKYTYYETVKNDDQDVYDKHGHLLYTITDTGTHLESHEVDDKVYVPVVVNPEDRIVGRNVVLDYNKWTDRGFRIFLPSRDTVPADLYKWTNPYK